MKNDATYAELPSDEKGEASHRGTLPCKVIVTDNPELTLGEGRMRHYRTLVAAASAFAKHPAPYKQVIYERRVRGALAQR